jgi:hypothetical protein
VCLQRLVGISAHSLDPRYRRGTTREHQGARDVLLLTREIRCSGTTRNGNGNGFAVIGPNEKAIATTGYELISAKRTEITNLTTVYGWPSNQNTEVDARRKTSALCRRFDRCCQLL